MSERAETTSVERRAQVGVIDLEAQRPNFARIAKVAKALFGTPVADVVAVHAEFRWSSRDAAFHSADEASPVSVAAAGDGVYWLEDASADPLWASHRVVVNAPYVRFCAAAPIILADGQRLGVLCVYDVTPKPYDRALAERLADLADVIANECDRERERQVLVRTQQRLNTAVKLGQLHVWELDYEARTLEKMGAEDSFYERPVTYQDLIGDPYFRIHPEDVAQFENAWANWRKDQPLPTFETRVKRNDKVDVWASMTTRPILDKNGEIVRMIGVMQNITARKQAELELIQTRDEAQAANRSKAAFLANMSHELRTPLNGVTGLTEALGRTALDDDQREMLDIISTSARTLDTLLSDLLDVSRLDSGEIEIRREPFDLIGSIRACTALHAPGALAKGLAFEVDVSPCAEGLWVGDANRIRQVLMHLLSNAVKFTDKGEVRLLVESHGRGLRFTVSDTGIGFDAETKAHLFERFVQADATSTRQHGGAGLGLALSKALAQAMGAALEASSEPGRGAAFTFTLDCARVAKQPCAGLDKDDPSALRVLVAEDHPTNRKVVAIMLGSFGVDLTFAENGQEAVDLFRMSRFDLVFMDMQMPVMDGLTAIRAIRDIESAEGRARTPVYTLTANAMPEHALASADAGSDGHVTKPVTSETLLRVLTAVCQGEAMVRTAAAA